ncbi:uncharacterized protein LOC131599882 [Vicia villosa]|uniref:uncharacterized protein LOC131599882 n=1 Tax=Vicia villosa TaxID=3911 RepID=UPI00273AEE34|nr:uncharacterized protein LOC131599882 [Vicia villosa]
MDTNQNPQTTTNCNSPEFEFWMLRNPSFPQPNLLTADELFVDGVLLPLHLIPATNNPDPPQQSPNPDPLVKDPDPEPESQPESSPAITESSTTATFSSSKRWKDIFRKGENKITEDKEKEKENKKKEKKKERKNGNGSSSAELNINIWPFSRSRSAGNTGTRPKLFPPVTRKVNSAPCSRSNSTGESKSRKWPSSPGRAGVHVGRSSPVWQVRRGISKNSEQQPNTEKASKTETTATRRSKVVSSGGGKTRVLNLNVPMCIGYRHHLSCRSDESGSAVGVSGGAVANGGGECHNDEGSGGNIFNLRNLFTKKSIVTSH